MKDTKNRIIMVSRGVGISMTLLVHRGEERSSIPFARKWLP